MAKVTQITADLALPFVEQAGCTLWDVEYVKEAGSYFLRVYIDKEGGVSIQDCEAVSRPLSDALDEADPIQDSYVLEVSSAVADRVLKKPEDLDRSIGGEVEIKFYKARDGRKSCVAILRGYTQDGRLTLEENGAQFTLEKQDVAQVRLYPRFS